MKVQSIGSPLLSHDDIKLYLDEFLEAYNDRPIKDNQGGMASPHCFATWCMLKKISPNFVIESGVFKGQGTWLIEKALPGVKLFSIEPWLNRIEYTSNQAKYLSSDFSLIDWSKEDIIPEQTVCFFDDHQDCPPRLLTANKFGFTKLIFEDNYPIGQGDCISLKHLLESNSPLSLRKQIKTYWEFPPVNLSSHVRWGDKWNDDLYPTQTPIFNSIELQYKIFSDEAQSYTWICYLETLE